MIAKLLLTNKEDKTWNRTGSKSKEKSRSKAVSRLKEPHWQPNKRKSRSRLKLRLEIAKNWHYKTQLERHVRLLVKLHH